MKTCMLYEKAVNVTHRDRGLVTPDAFDLNISQMQYGRQDSEHVGLKLVTQSWMREVCGSVTNVDLQNTVTQVTYRGL